MEPDWDIILPILMVVLVGALVWVVWRYFVRRPPKQDPNLFQTVVRSSRKGPLKVAAPAARESVPSVPPPGPQPTQGSDPFHTIIRSVRKPAQAAAPGLAPEAPRFPAGPPAPPQGAAPAQDFNPGHTVIRSIRRPLKGPAGQAAPVATPGMAPPGHPLPGTPPLPKRRSLQASGSWIGGPIDKTVWRRGKVKIMLPRQERRLLKVIPVVVVVAALLALYLGWKMTQDPLRTDKIKGEDHILSKLNKEKLVPPPPMPPEFFVNSERPEILDANRDWSRMDPTFQQAVLRILERLKAKGIAFTLLEGYRSPERQDRLALLGAHVTRAKAFQSKHQYGLAADLAPILNGKLCINERAPGSMEAYEAMGHAAAAEGLVWGGSWSNLKDFGHIEAAGRSR